MLDLKWTLKWHANIFAGTQRYADEHGWESSIDEYIAEHLADKTKDTSSPLYDGVIGRADAKLAECAQQLRIPLVNVWFNSPVRDQLPGVFVDSATTGRLQAEHLLARGLRRFGVLTYEDQAQKLAVEAFHETVSKEGFKCLLEKIPVEPSRNFLVWRKTEWRIEAWMDRWQLPGLGPLEHECVDGQRDRRQSVQHRGELLNRV